MYGYVIILLLFTSANCFNFDTDNPIVFVDPGAKKNPNFSSYFGYTIVLFPGSKSNPDKWIKIGAPRGQNPLIRSHNSGVVYECPFMKGCTVVNVHKGNYDKDEVLNGSWIGGSMDISYKYDRMAVCAFRLFSIQSRDYRTTGACYWSSLNTTTFEKVIPLKDTGKAVYKSLVYNYGQGQAGFSAHFPNEQNELILGSPGVYNWAGTTIKISDRDYEIPIESRRKREVEEFKNISVADAINSSVNNVFDLFGYAVSSGYFYGRAKLYYAATTPRADVYKGKVVIFEFNLEQPLLHKESKVGSQFGEYFGASIAVGDINSDGCDDLIVGAPFHVTSAYNEGRVYTFLGSRKDNLQQVNPINGHSPNGQFGTSVMFLGDIDHDGYGDVAIGAPYEEEFGGVLYIYKGTKFGLNTSPCQKIIGKSISSEIRGFGISISRPADMDGNGYKDIAVGAHLSSNAVLLRGRPIIVVKSRLKSYPKELIQDTKTFLLEACYWYTHYNEDKIDIKRTVVVDELLGRATLLNKFTNDVKVVTVDDKNTFCENITVFVKNTTNYVAPITATLSYELHNSIILKEVLYVSDRVLKGKETFCVRCPVLDAFRSTKVSTLNVPFSLGCGSDNICQSELSITAEVPTLRKGNVFVVGSADYVTLHVTVENKGEKAYSTRLEVSLPETVNFRQISSFCNVQNVSVIICDVDNPLNENEKKTISLDLDMKNVNKDNEKNELFIYLKVLTSSSNSHLDLTVFKFKLEREADITISGKPYEQSTSYGNNTSGKPNFTQIYQVEKIGVSPLERVLVVIKIPHTIHTPSGDLNFIKLFPPNGVFSGQPIVCQSNFTYIYETKDTEISEKLVMENFLTKRRRRQVEVFNKSTINGKEEIIVDNKEFEILPNITFFLNCSMREVECSNVECYVGPFNKQQVPATIHIKMQLDIPRLYGLLETKSMVLVSTQGVVTIESPSGFIQNGDRHDSVEVSSLFVSEIAKKTEVALWIIIVSVIAGLLLLVLIVLGLYKMGFFKRAKKEELQNLKAAAENEDNVIEESQGDIVNSSDEGLVDDDEDPKL